MRFNFEHKYTRRSGFLMDELIPNINYLSTNQSSSTILTTAYDSDGIPTAHNGGFGYKGQIWLMNWASIYAGTIR
jgi:hypothetical protein